MVYHMSVLVSTPDVLERNMHFIFIFGVLYMSIRLNSLIALFRASLFLLIFFLAYSIYYYEKYVKVFFFLMMSM